MCLNNIQYNYLMYKKLLSLKDFELSMCTDALARAELFQNYIHQMSQFETKSYWIMSQSNIGAKMTLEGTDSMFDSYISNDYLGMSQHKETIDAGINALKKYGTGACAAQPIGGYLDVHQKLEKEISDFVGQEDAILFSSGFGANAGLLRALLGKNDIAYIDSYIHTSAYSGLIGTNTKHIGHNDIEYLDMILNKEKDKYQTRIVIVDGVYSQNGDLSKLPEYISICKKHNCLLMVDDAHGIGVMGNNGRGTAEHYNCLGQVDIITGTFSKSFGCVGGFVAASSKLIQYLRYYADSNVFSAAITPQVTCSVLKALELIKKQPSIRQKLWNNVEFLRTGLLKSDFDIGMSVSPIFPLMVRDNEKVYQIADLLQKKRIFASGIVYPAVRTKEARIRISVLASHEITQLKYLINCLEEIRLEIPF